MNAPVSTRADCLICEINDGERPVPSGIVYADDLWVVVPAAPPYGVPGWMTLHTKRHVPGPAHFDDIEAACFGPALRHFERVLEEVTGAVRIYTAAMGESSPHFHGHMVPKYRHMPDDAKAWAVFDLPRRAVAGEIAVDAALAESLVTAYRDRLHAQPLPANATARRA